MKKRVRLLSAIIAGVLMTMCACSPSMPQQSEESNSEMASLSSTAENQSQTEDNNVYSVGIVQIVNHPSLNTIRDAFMEEMSAALGDMVEFDCKDAQNDMSNVNSICQKFVGDKKDLIVAIATPAAQAAAAATQEIPILYSAVTDPEAAKLTGISNVTGTSDAIPVEQIFNLASTLTPEAKSFGLIYNTSEVNSVSVINEAKEYMNANGYTYTEATVTNTSEVLQSASSLVGKVDAIFTPIDNTIATAMPVLAGVGMNNKIPVYVGADSMVSDGGLATVGIDYSVLGVRTAQMGCEILGGKSPAEIPYEVMDDFSVIINKKTAKDIGIEIPQEIEEDAILFGE